MSRKFRYKFDKRSKYITWAIFIVILIAFAAMYFFGHGNYLPAWFLSFAIAIAALYILSIPLYITTKDDYLEIHCVVELTKIHLADIRSIRAISPEEIKPSLPVLGSFGFFGYYGYYFNIREWDTFKLYATEWDNLIEIEDIYEQRYVVSCPEREELILTIRKHCDDYRAEFENID